MNSSLTEKWNSNQSQCSENIKGKPVIYVSKYVRDACSVYISKGRINNTASKLIASKNKCMRIGK